MSAFRTETVLDVRHWTDTLFSFRTTRDPAFRFENGQFAMIGLEIDGKPLVRAYSMASANYEEDLEFFSIKVPDGPLTSRLQHLAVGDKVLVGNKPTGTLLTENLLPGKVLYMLSTGTGLAPFLSLIKDPAVYEKFDRVVLAHGCRYASELAYGDLLRQDLRGHPLVGDQVQEQFSYYPTVTREDHDPRGRISDLMRQGKLFGDLRLAPLHPDDDRLMLCGSPAMLDEMTDWVEGLGFAMGNNAGPGSYVIEKAFVER